MDTLRRFALAFVVALPVAASAAPLSAADAKRELAAGAQAWDLREAAGPTIASAAAAPRAALQQWLARGDLTALAQALSSAGLDLSRDVLLYGEAGDPLGLALHEALARVATGRVHWLVGGFDEWRAAGLPTAAAPSRPLPVPQRLVWRAPEPVPGEPAAAALRRGQTASPQRIAASAL